MHIIAHRGASSIATDNSAKAISLAAELAVRYIEFDVQHTKDNRVVVYHDTITPSGINIRDVNYNNVLQEVPGILTLKQALNACGTVPALIESKVAGTVARSLSLLKKCPTAAIASFISDEILAARIQAPGHATFLLQHFHPFGIVNKAVAVNAHGIGVNKYWLLILPYFYRQSKKRRLKMYIYTVNSLLLARIISKLMPNAMLCTDQPKKLLNDLAERAS